MTVMNVDGLELVYQLHFTNFSPVIHGFKFSNSDFYESSLVWPYSYEVAMGKVNDVITREIV